MNVVIVPGYGDRTDYLKPTLRRWRRRYGQSPSVLQFGWSGEAKDFEGKWHQFYTTLQGLGEVAIIGISAGASVAVRALQESPERVTGIVTVCGPLRRQFMSEEKLTRSYPLLDASLSHIDPDIADSHKIMTLRPLFDEVVDIRAMEVAGARDLRTKTVGHAWSIAWGMYHQADGMHEFLSTSA